MQKHLKCDTNVFKRLKVRLGQEKLPFTAAPASQRRMQHTHFFLRVFTLSQKKEASADSYNDKIKWEEVITTAPILAS